MDIRKPNDSELETIIQLSPQAIIDGTMGEVNPTKEKTKQLIEHLTEKGSYYLIAIDNDILMGWIFIGENRDSLTDKQNGFIYELFVREAFRGKGVARQLVQTAMNQLKQNGFSEVRLSAFAGNHVIKLYERMGFHIRTVSMSQSL
ncbi:GNAT family N-acetyltransferase [Aquibacillus rhizosphaerae]|uniref:GNAT family N-acetyltransferase n=1 Tax=Aquibacillus rhizosphaerae TaxID=3051431 RepID=A0ABT7L1T0_9BACI|nr:GNAT family N-acetyltransferase [Aquibacillus sp. LR5S19]MDL4839814.1 GNAT family N-acetyltransferase [Aquibacillus sp. LR5S19]